MTLSDDLNALAHGCSDAEALAFFDALPPVRSKDIFGRWSGSEVRTKHPMSGLLESFGWYGKEFIDEETVHPLLFKSDGGKIFTVDPRKVPMNLAAHVPQKAATLGRKALAAARSLVSTDEPRARLRDMEFRGKVSATMIYDHLPIQDMFRQVDSTTLLGVMDRRAEDRYFYFVLRRAE
jgi:hypothetical protein